ncbi:MAG: DUF981 family protein [Sedimentisphaerales bacterium]|nr:DUF981 family protein [Sedimentisphaerales bacterium]
MIDCVTLMRVNMTGGLLVLAAFLVWGFETPHQRTWAPAFGITGLLATVSGLAMTFTWSIPAPFSMAYWMHMNPPESQQQSRLLHPDVRYHESQRVSGICTQRLGRDGQLYMT